MNDQMTPGLAAGGAGTVIVLGAGMTGLVATSVLLEQGNSSVTVLDEYPNAGGNHLDATVGAFTFDVGSFIFQDDSPLVAHFPELLDRYVPISPRWGKLNPQGAIGAFPFSVQEDFLAAGPVECGRILLSVAAARLSRRRMSSARDFARYWIGERMLYRSGLENYMERFYGRPADEIDLGFARQRMMWIAEHASVRGVLRHVVEMVSATPPPPRRNQQLARPPEGFKHLYEPVLCRLEERGATFELDVRLHAISRRGDRLAVTTSDGIHLADRVISTIPVDRARVLCGVPGERELPTATLVSLFFSFLGVRGFDEPILYNFSHGGSWKRLTVYSDFYGIREGRQYFSVEVLGDQVAATAERAEREFREHVAANGLFDGDLRLEGSHVLRNAYPLYTEGADRMASDAISLLRSLGVESFGRQGGFHYQPTARVSTHAAEDALGAPRSVR